MSITPNVLKNKRKTELKEIASDLGLNTKGLRHELEDRIRIHLESSESSKSEEEKPISTSGRATPRRSIRRSINSNKLRKDSIPPPPNGDRPSSDDENPSVSSEGESKQVIKQATILEKPTQYVNNQLTFESSQQDIAINTHTTSDSEITEPNNRQGLQSDRTSRFNTAHEFLLQLRNSVSNSETFCKVIICLELVVFLYGSIDWNYKVTSIYINEDINFDIHAPDISMAANWHRFLRPLISFSFYLSLLPLGFSYIINFEPQRHLCSPLTFSVAQFTIFMVSISHFDWTEDVRDFIPDNLIYTGAGAGIIFALYESILVMREKEQ